MPSLTTYKLLKQEHDARRGEFKTVHGTVQTPAFQNVATKPLPIAAVVLPTASSLSVISRTL